MVSKSFDINARNLEPFSPESRRLILEWSPSHLLVMLWDQGLQQPFAIESFAGNLLDEESWEEVSSQSALLAFTDLDTEVVVADVRALPVPMAFSNADRARAEIDLYHGHLPAMHTGMQMVKHADLLVFWQVPLAFHQWVTRRFRVVHWKHICAMVLERQLLREESTGRVIIYNGFAWVIISSGSQLHYAWPLTFIGAKDIAWHLLNTCSQLGISEADIHWQPCGRFSTEAPLFVGFTQFLHKISLDTEASPLSEEVPAYFFSHLYPATGA